MVPTSHQPDAAALARALDGGVRSVFQPIVELDTGRVVAYEALARGPEGPLERPDQLFAAARAAGRLTELDEACRAAAFRGAVAHGLLDPLTVFVNVEPEVLDAAPLADLLAIAESAPRALRVVLEVTERALAARPAELLRTVERVRRSGWAVALDDVGADPMSLSFMPLLRPDVVKLDLRLVQERPGPEIAQIMNAVNAYAESTGALVLAEGIETEAHLVTARALGAELGQGWLFGRPADGPAAGREVGRLVLPPPDCAEDGLDSSPFRCLPPGARLRHAPKALLVELSKQLEREAVRVGETCVVGATFQEARHLTPATVRRYRELAGATGFVCALGEGVPAEPVPGVRGADLAEDDPVRGEWDLVVLGPHFAAALLARDLGSTGPDAERPFEYALTYDRATVVRAAQALLSRVAPRSPGAVPDLDPEPAPTVVAALPPVPAPRSPARRHRAVLDGLAATDPLTGLPARQRTEELLDVAVWGARTGADALALLVVTVDGLGEITDRHGTAVADDLLRTIASRLRTRLRRGDVLGRIGPSSFAVGLGGLAPADAALEAGRIRASLLDTVRSPLVAAGNPVVLDAQIGTALCPGDGDDVRALLRAATAGRLPR